MNNSQNFIKLEILASFALVMAAALAILLANSLFSEHYLSFINLPVVVRIGEIQLAKPLQLWINDGLMAIFFLLVALELKREVIEGELSSFSQIGLPLVGAIGGILVPAFIYYLCTKDHGSALHGWAIPAATDIAFALGVLSLLGNRVPKSLSTFLLSLAVFDDIGAIIIIAIWYTGNISWLAHLYALASLLVLLAFNRFGVTRLSPYFFVGILLWFFVLKSGVHATLAGVLLGLTIPLRAKDSHGESPLSFLEHALHPWVAFLIVPLFAFGNAGVSLKGITLSALNEPITLGIILGLVVGKMAGVFSFSYLLILAGRARLPEGSNLISFLGVCIISGIGFTMSLFIGTLAFEHTWAETGVYVRLGVLVGSLISIILGVIVLKVGLRSTAKPVE